MGRCYNDRHPAFPNYGGRGIAVCERWHVVANFVADMDGSFVPGTELDRRDNDREYSPENCRWVSKAENARNKRTVTMVTIDGVTKPAVQWARENGIRKWIAWYRIKHLGWDPVDAVTVPKLSAHEVASRASAVAVASRAKSRKPL